MENSGTVYGFGINDAGYPVKKYECARNRSKAIWHCAFYRVWENMIRRCYSAKYQGEKPTYKGCSVSGDWRTFSAFRAWMVRQDHCGNQLDKDLLLAGNKVYSPDTCCFVSRGLNQFLTDAGARRGKWPIGVYFHARDGVFRAQINNPFTGGREFLGDFATPEAAHESWRTRKHELSCIYADMQTDPRIAAALRTRYIQQKESE